MNTDCRQLSSWKGRVHHVPKLHTQLAHCKLVLLLYICGDNSPGGQFFSYPPYKFWSWRVVLFRWQNGPQSGELSCWGIVLWITTQVLVGNGWALFLSGGELSSWGVVLVNSVVIVYLWTLTVHLYPKIFLDVWKRHISVVHCTNIQRK